MAKGAQGSICGLANFAPELAAPGDPRRRRRAARSGPSSDLVVSNPVMPAVKALVAHRHRDPAYARTRPPLVDLDPGPRRRPRPQPSTRCMAGAAAA